MTKNSKTALMVTTEHRGVFFGYGHKSDDKIIELERARMCVFWSKDMKGVMGLATMGPSPSCRISPAVKSITLQGVTSVIEVSDEAKEKWERQPWKK